MFWKQGIMLIIVT